MGFTKETVPPGVNQGTVSRLAGMGKGIDKSQKGDLFLKVSIHPWH